MNRTSRLQFWFTETGTFYLAGVRIAEVPEQVIAFTNVIPAAGGKNLVPNGTFAVGACGWSSLGTPAGWGNLAHLHGRAELSGPAPSGAFLRIPFGGGKTPVLAFDYLRPSVRTQTRSLAANIGWIRVDPGSDYTLSCAMRAGVGGGGGLLSVVCADPAHTGSFSLEQKVVLSTAWSSYSLTFRPTAPYLFVAVGPDLDRDQLVNVDIARVQLEKGGRATPFEPRSAVEVGIEPAQPGGIFTEGEPAALWVRICNASREAVRVPIALRATDFFDRPVAMPPVSIDLPAESTIARRVALPPGWRGYYRVRADWSANRSRQTIDLRIAVVPRRTSDSTVLGINHAFPDSFLIRQARRAGVSWYRDWSLKWQDIEPEPGLYHWEVGDAQIDRVLQEHAQLMALLPPFPSADWASEAAPDLPDKEGRLREAWAPKDPSMLAAFIEQAVARYRDRVHVWEFLNEPIYTDYALPGSGRYPGPRYTAADYVRLLRLAAAAMRRSDPACRVIGGVASGPEYLTDELMAAGILSIIDLFNLHIYPGLRAPEGYIAGMDRFLRAMDARGARKPIWITEFSYYATDDLPRTPFIPGDGNWAEGRLLRSERECAAYTTRFLTIMLAHGVEKVFVHSGASGTVNMPNLESCLFAAGGAPRKVLPAVAVLTELLGPHPKCVSFGQIGAEGREAAFETGTRSVVVLWAAASGGNNLILRDRSVRCLDIMGREIPPGAVRLSSDPIYLVGLPGRARSIAASLGMKEP